MNRDSTAEEIKIQSDEIALRFYKDLGHLQKSIEMAQGNLNEMGILGTKIDNISKGQDEIKSDVKEIKEQTQLTNGRVTKLETWQEDTVKWVPRYVSTALFLIVAIISIASYAYLQDQKYLRKEVANIIRKELDLTEIIFE